MAHKRSYRVSTIVFFAILQWGIGNGSSHAAKSLHGNTKIVLPDGQRIRVGNKKRMGLGPLKMYREPATLRELGFDAIAGPDGSPRLVLGTLSSALGRQRDRQTRRDNLPPIVYLLSTLSPQNVAEVHKNDIRILEKSEGYGGFGRGADGERNTVLDHTFEFGGTKSTVYVDMKTGRMAIGEQGFVECPQKKCPQKTCCGLAKIAKAIRRGVGKAIKTLSETIAKLRGKSPVPPRDTLGQLGGGRLGAPERLVEVVSPDLKSLIQPVAFPFTMPVQSSNSDSSRSALELPQ